jgi:transcriptional regulator with XRE-family HTH domain
MPIFDGLGRSLRWLRERQVKRQYQVAAGAGITKAMLSAYETGKQKPSLDTLEKILDALVCDLNDLHNALQIVNGRPERMRSAGGDPWRVAGTAGEGAPSGPGLYEILGAEEPLPQQEEQAMSEMLGGFHKLLRYMHGRIPRGALATSPAPSQAQPPATPGDPSAPPEAKPSPPAGPDPADRSGS